MTLWLRFVSSFLPGSRKSKRKEKKKRRNGNHLSFASVWHQNQINLSLPGFNELWIKIAIREMSSCACVFNSLLVGLFHLLFIAQFLRYFIEVEIESAIISLNESNRIRKIFGSIWLIYLRDAATNGTTTGTKRIATHISMDVTWRRLCEKSDKQKQQKYLTGIKGTEHRTIKDDTVNLPPSQQHSTQTSTSIGGNTACARDREMEATTTKTLPGKSQIMKKLTVRGERWSGQFICSKLVLCDLTLYNIMVFSHFHSFQQCSLHECSSELWW